MSFLISKQCQKFSKNPKPQNLQVKILNLQIRTPSARVQYIDTKTNHAAGGFVILIKDKHMNKGYKNYENKMSSINIGNFAKNVDVVFRLLPSAYAKGKVTVQTFGWGKMMLVFDFAGRSE